jgi:hypothetical protein
MLGIAPASEPPTAAAAEPPKPAPEPEPQLSAKGTMLGLAPPPKEAIDKAIEEAKQARAAAPAAEPARQQPARAASAPVAPVRPAPKPTLASSPDDDEIEPRRQPSDRNRKVVLGIVAACGVLGLVGVLKVALGGGDEEASPKTEPARVEQVKAAARPEPAPETEKPSEPPKPAEPLAAEPAKTTEPAPEPPKPREPPKPEKVAAAPRRGPAPRPAPAPRAEPPAPKPAVRKPGSAPASGGTIVRETPF